MELITVIIVTVAVIDCCMIWLLPWLLVPGHYYNSLPTYDRQDGFIYKRGIQSSDPSVSPDEPSSVTSSSDFPKCEILSKYPISCHGIRSENGTWILGCVNSNGEVSEYYSETINIKEGVRFPRSMEADLGCRFGKSTFRSAKLPFYKKNSALECFIIEPRDAVRCRAQDASNSISSIKGEEAQAAALKNSNIDSNAIKRKFEDEEISFKQDLIHSTFH